MAFILVLILHKSEAYSFDACQIVVLHVQSKPYRSMAAMQMLHGVCQICVKLFIAFRARTLAASLFCRGASDSASAKCTLLLRPGNGKPLADVRHSC
jgi:hypothetical protein